MSEVLAALLIGAVAGLAIAVPLGAVSVLLLRTGLASGWRVAAAGALGVATVDVLYAAVATVAGAAVATGLSGHQQTLRLAGAALLGAIAVRGLLRTLSQARGQVIDGPTRPVDDGAVGPGATWARFAGITALNPATVLYFVVVAAGFADRWGEGAGRVAFVVGVGVASAAWQLGLAAIGSLAGSRIGRRARLALAVAGDCVVLGLAVALALA